MCGRGAVRVRNRRNQVRFRTIPVLVVRKFNLPTTLLTHTVVWLRDLVQSST